MRSAGANTRIVLRSACLLALVCIVISSLSVFAFDRAAAPNLVFCPLQKQWVKKDVPEIRRAVDSLADICAKESNKAVFVSRLSVRLAGRVLADVSIAPLFLDFVSKGDRALGGIVSRPASQDEPLASLSKRSVSQLTVRRNSAVRIREQFAIHQTSSSARRNSLRGLFERHFAELQTIYRSIKSRAPPTSL